LAPVVEALQAMRGVSMISAIILAAEIGDFHRFVHPRQLVSYLGLAPSEHSSGKSVIRGSITKAGSKYARSTLIEGAWTYCRPARVGQKIAYRHDGLPKEVLDIAWKAQLRLCHRYGAMRARGKHHNKTVIAIAREMACFLWAMARIIKPSPLAAVAS
jgi:transposase